jgi:hypothetical protein
MRKVEQTSLIDGPSEDPGDCLRSAWASVLECRAGDLPKWSGKLPWKIYWRNFQLFLRLKGYKIKRSSYARPLPFKTPFDSFVAVGSSPRTDDAKHCVVYDWDGFAWDPYPGANGLVGDPQLYEWLVKEDPDFDSTLLHKNAGTGIFYGRVM